MKYQRIYFVGAGGIGMAALERYFLAQGLPVAGYDRTPTPLTAELQREGVEISFSDLPEEAIPTPYRTVEGTLVVYTPAVPAAHPVMAYFTERGYAMMKRAQVLGLLTRDTLSLCFAGTHGKTTTSAMAAHILEVEGTGCNAFLGGELLNYSSNLLLSPGSAYTVAEADEFDRSFHHLRPYVAVITSADPDHLDIYGTAEEYREAFAHFTSLIRPGGALIMHAGVPVQPRTLPDVKVLTYGTPESDFYATDILAEDGTLTFTFHGPDTTIADIPLGVPAEVNIDNAVAAIAACLVATDGELDTMAIRRAMGSFRGARRRFEKRLDIPGGPVIIDDYAHHPAEIEASIASVRRLYPDRHLTVAFQPHLYTRTRDFAAGFAAALSHADTLFLLDIYPAREEPLPGITSATIMQDVTLADATLVTKRDAVDAICHRGFELLLVLGAGDIADLLPDLVSRTRNR